MNGTKEDYNLYQKIKVLALLQADFTYQKVCDQLDVSNGCITGITKNEE